MEETRSETQDNEAVFEPNPVVDAIIKAFEGLIYIVSNNYRIIYSNSKIKGGKNRLRTERCYKVIHGRKTPCPFCVMDQVQKGQTVKFELKNPADHRWYYSINTPVYHSDGDVSLLAMITDIHNSKIAENFLKKRGDQLQRRKVFSRPDILERSKFGSIVGKTQVMQDIYRQILNAAATDAGIIIYGEPGTGKELVARVIHDMSKRRKKRFVPVHCGAIPEQLFESEFFGYKKGAFSGAETDRNGYLDFADKGTLFLDEIGEISPHMQVKLLRAIEGGGFTPVGSNRVKCSDFRIIAATNRDIKQLVNQGMMRKDFFYRIHILPIRLPPLRERRDDIPLLADYFLKQYFGGDDSLLPVSKKFYDTLQNYDWPGNIRELQNAIIRYCVTRSLNFINTRIAELNESKEKIALTTGKITENSHKTLKEYLCDLEKNIIEETLKKNQWNRSKTADILGVDRKTIASKIKRYGLIGTDL